jgi:SAM-dependent methyltransferase
LNIERGDLVLEVGSGHNPKTRADVLCDKYIEDNTQRGGTLILDRPLIVADGEALPFRGKSFDYVICSHVLEHADDAVRFLSEVERVGRAGYIETPSEVAERLYGWDYHRWYVNVMHGQLVLRPKTERSPFGQLFHRLAARDRDFARFHERYHHLMLVQYEWSDRIDYRVDLPAGQGHDLSDSGVIDAITSENRPDQRLMRVTRVVWGRLPARLRARLKAGRARARGGPRVDLRELLVCPRCCGALEWQSATVSCPADGLEFQVDRGVPIMLLPDGVDLVR